MRRRPWNEKIGPAQLQAERACLDQISEQTQTQAADLRWNVFRDNMTDVARGIGARSPQSRSAWR